MLINVKMPKIGILTLMSRIHFVLSRVEHEKSFITSGLNFRNLTLKHSLQYGQMSLVGVTINAHFDYHDSITITETTITMAYYHDTITILSGFLKNES